VVCHSVPCTGYSKAGATPPQWPFNKTRAVGLHLLGETEDEYSDVELKQQNEDPNPSRCRVLHRL